jgi:superfamily II DNA or RNA helicase
MQKMVSTIENSTFDSKRTADQRAFIELWKKHSWKGSLVSITGYGKTRVGLMAAKEVNLLFPGKSIHVIVPTRVLQEQWETEVKIAGIDNIEIFVVNTYIKKRHNPFLLILDEIHRYASDQFRKVFSSTTYVAILGLTASMERQDGKHVLIQEHAPILKTIKLADALHKGFVSPFMIFNLAIKLNKAEYKAYQEIDKRFETYFECFNRDFESVKAAMISASYRNKLSMITGKSVEQILIEAANYFYFLHKRKRFLYEHPAKLRALKEIFQVFDQKMIVFSESIAFANSVTEAIGEQSFAYHTSVNKRVLSLKMDEFRKTEKYKVLAAVKALDEGLNIPDLSMAVIVSGNATKRQYIQRIGRSLRKQPGKTALIINLYIHETQDEKWLRRRQFSNDFNVIWVEDVESIKRLFCKENDRSPLQFEYDQFTNPSFNHTAAHL